MLKEEREELERLYDNSPDVIGGYGEALTASTLRSDLRMSIVRSLYIGRSQIDMVAVTPSCVYVIENKNYHGVVSGHGSSVYWNVNYTPYRTHKLYNPVMQNARHVSDVTELLKLTGYSSIPVHSLVIFNDLVELRLIEMPRQVFKLRDFVDSYEEPTISVLDDDYVNALTDLFCKFRDCSDEVRLAHLKRVSYWGRS